MAVFGVSEPVTVIPFSLRIRSSFMVITDGTPPASIEARRSTASGVTFSLRTAEASSGFTEGFLSITGGLFLSSNNSATVLSGVPEASADLSKAAC